MRKILSILALVISGTFVAYGQQIPQYTQYSLNEFVINPAIAGTQDYYNARIINRYQWLGVVDAPRTYVLSLYGPHKKLNMGFGGYIFSDITGPTRRSGLELSYAYNLKIINDIRVSFGVSGGFLQYKIDATKITFKDESDIVKEFMYVDYMPDASAGIYLYADKYYFGVSSSQLLHNKIVFYDLESNTLRRLANHIFVYGGYKYDINDKFNLEPSLLLKKVNPVPLMAEINAKLTYNKMIWLSLGYRTANGPNITLGYNMQDQLYFGYSYDFTMSAISKATTGTHEFMIGARFNQYREAKTQKLLE
ncbi:MAG: hypothetical protein A2046_02580 [Bacteroidetes bacterium GWA2_30_7]|nr:MAG: hypothetical protein A2046_02580 [Bacteroidetes bacterium GWA2_30_7]